jgi:manganese/zinc/iron transport system substrate-binding protein
MNQRLRRLLFVSLALIVIIISIIGYDLSQGRAKRRDNKLYVTVTTTFLGDIVEQIGGAYVEVTRLMGPGVDPHQYQASSSDLDKLTTADLVLYGGLHLEAKLGDVLEQLASSGSPVVDTSSGIDKRNLIYADNATDEQALNEQEDEGGMYDPHIWFDIDLWRDVVTTIKATLSAHDQVHETEYEQNAQRYLAELDELNAYIIRKITELPENARYLVSAHDAFNYFGRYTGIEVKGIQGINTSVEAGTSDVSNMASFIVEHKIKAIFVESSVSPKLVQALQEAALARGHKVDIGGELFSDSTGSIDTPEGTYVGMYKHNIDTIVNALK